LTTIDYPWYEIVEGDSLEQGDILRACPVVIPTPEYPVMADNVIVDLQIFDIIIMTQSCDLENDKVRDLIVCPHWDLNQAGQRDASLASKKAWKEIIKGHQYRYAMLSAWDGEVPTGIRVVDFGRIFSLPRNFVMQFATSQGKRLRLLPPYREHLSQSFARFFMRVGLPQDIKLPE
jgi:hypothetical protein